jgi:hypothetical protein
MSAQRELAPPLGRTTWIGWCVPVLAAILLLAAPAEPIVSRAPAGLLPSLALTLPSPRVLAEIGKQALEQPLHFAMAAAPVCLSRSLVGVPWYGWAITPLLVWREWSQWPSQRWWDPPLDWAFMALGLVVASWRRGRRAVVAGPRAPRHPLRRRAGAGSPTIRPPLSRRRASPCGGNTRAGRPPRRASA